MDKRNGASKLLGSNSLWNYTLEVYGVDRIREIVLRWQDDYGCDINMIMCCCWLASRRQRLSGEQLAQLQKIGAQWRSQCLLPLRSVRRFVKSQANTDSLYRQLKDAEISAEKWHQTVLFECAEGFPRAQTLDSNGVGIDNLQAYCQLLSGVEWSDLTEEATELLGLLKL